MKELNDFILEHIEYSKTSILERLKLNNDSKINDSFNKLNCIICPIGTLFGKMTNLYSEYKIEKNNGFTIFVMPIKIMKQYSKAKGLLSYKIPKKFKSVEDIKQYYLNNDEFFDDLEILKL